MNSQVRESSRLDEAGFWIEEGVFSASVCERLAEELSLPHAWRGRAGARNLMGHPAVASIASDRRLVEIARRALCKDEAVPYRATLFEKSVRASWLVAWHQDTALPLASRFDAEDWGPWSCKAGVEYAHAPAWALARVVALRIHLDASTHENGPLRVVPGSHTVGVLSSEDVSTYASTHERVECLVNRGGVLVMSPLLIHSSSKAKGGGSRRVLHIEYADSLELAPDIRLALA